MIEVLHVQPVKTEKALLGLTAELQHHPPHEAFEHTPVPVRLVRMASAFSLWFGCRLGPLLLAEGCFCPASGSLSSRLAFPSRLGRHSQKISRFYFVIGTSPPNADVVNVLLGHGQLHQDHALATTPSDLGNMSAAVSTL